MCFNVVRADHAGMSRAWAAAALVVVLWASAFAAIRAALEGFTAIELSVLRLLVASVALAVAAVVIARAPPRARATSPRSSPPAPPA